MRSAIAWTLALAAWGCSAAPPAPALLDTRNDACATCRMVVSDAKFAAQVVAPGEEPAFFDDLGCLAAYLGDHGRLPAHAIAYVADHRSGAWTPAASAVFTKVPALATPMGSHLVAHASTASRDADDGVRGGAPVAAADLFPRSVPDGSR